MKTSIIAAVAVSCNAKFLESTHDHGLLKAFKLYCTKFGKSYHHKHEFAVRYQAFAKNYAKMQEHNSKNDTSFTVGYNKFSDQTDEEYRAMLGYKQPHHHAKKNVQVLKADAHIANQVDWVARGAVTPVKNQGQCGSCWSFSSTGAMEGAHQIKTGHLVSLSEQQLMDCSKAYGNQSCEGGLMDQAFQYAETAGLETEAEYPYTETDDVRCKKNLDGKVKVTSYSDVTAGDNEQLKQFVSRGPVSIAIEADQMAFQGYTGGIIDSGCGSSLDHGVLIVGYGEEDGKKYWKVKNSWGPDWGEAGYVRIADKSGDGVCGINLSASQPMTN